MSFHNYKIFIPPRKTYSRKDKTADSARKINANGLSNIQLFRDPQKPSDNESSLIHNSINKTPTKEKEQRDVYSENASTEVVWLPSASQKGKKSLVLEDESTEMLHSEDGSDEDGTSISDQSDNEIEPFNSSGDTQQTNDSNNTTSKDNYGKTSKSCSNVNEIVNQRSEIINSTAVKRTYSRDILRQLKAVNSSGIQKQVAVIYVSKREFCQEWLQNVSLSAFHQDQKLIDYLGSKLKLKPNRVIESREYIKNIVSIYSYQLSRMWKESGKNKDIFYNTHSDWLDGAPIKLTASRPKDKKPTPIGPDKPLRINIETNADAFIFLKNFEPPFETDGLIKLVPCTDLNPEEHTKLIDFCNRYAADMKFKWLTCDNNEDVFIVKFEYWLKLNIKWPAFLKDVMPKSNMADSELGKNKGLNVTSKFCEELVMKLVLNCKIETIEKILASKSYEIGNDISKIMHTVIHHPEYTAIIEGAITDDRECGCDPQLAGGNVADKDTDALIKKFNPPSQAQKEVIKMTVERLKELIPTQIKSLQKTMLNDIVSKLKVAKHPLPNLTPIRKEVSQAQKISKVINSIGIHDDDKRSYKIAKGGKFRPKIVSRSETNKQLNQPTVCLTTVISTASNTIDNEDNQNICGDTSTEQTYEDNHKNLEFGPVLDNLLFVKPSNLKSGTIIELPKSKEAVICKVSNCSATVLVPKFIRQSGPNVRVRKSNFKMKRLVKKVTKIKKNIA